MIKNKENKDLLNGLILINELLKFYQQYIMHVLIILNSDFLNF